MESITYGCCSEAHFKHDETLCVCLGSNLRSYQTLSNEVTFEARPLCSLTQCIIRIIIIIISIYKEDNMIAILSYGPPVNTDIDYYRTFFGLF